MFELLRVVFVFVVMGIAAYQDYKTGEVSDRVWLLAPLGLILSLFSLVGADWFIVCLFTFSLVLSCVAGVLLSVFGGSRFGGADGKALIFLGLSMPLAGSFVLFPLVAFGFGAVVASVKYVLSKGKHDKVRFLPYVFVGACLALL